ncbi:VIT1/CCC1 transporter family protein [Candidatus Roizmanbacteria bacterium]|nr:VIT1/CCC1 transporter family protein [Candidatus Roizmanbacteria bacterium]
MSRVDKAREGFLKRDVSLIKKTHTVDAIHHSIHHHEAHLRNFNLPEIILGGQDGLVNVLGVILGVAAATSDSKVIIVAGLAATFAESISMAAVAYTSRLAEADYYQSEYEREKWEIKHVPEGEREEIKALYENYGFEGKILNEIVNRITSNDEIWLKVMMEQELKLEPTNRKQALPSAFIVGLSSFIGSIIPLTAFFFLPVRQSIILSIIVSTLVLFVVGYYKAKKTLGRQLVRQGVEIAVIGMASAAVGYLVGSLFKV